MDSPDKNTLLATGSCFFWELARYVFILGAVLAAAASALLLLQYALMATLWVYILIALSTSFTALPLAETLAFFALASSLCLVCSSMTMSVSGMFAGASVLCQLGDYLVGSFNGSKEPPGTGRQPGFFESGPQTVVATSSNDLLIAEL